MSANLTSVRSFLGKYYSELLYSASQEKYKGSGLDSFFEQRFLIQNNKVLTTVDLSMDGLSIVVHGNEVSVSKELFDHPSILITNSIESSNHPVNPRGLYNPEVFSTIAYLVCQNHTTIQVVGALDKPIYIKYKSDYETYYNSVVVFNIDKFLDVEIVEEIESLCALNAVTNYVLGESSTLNLFTFYQNRISAVSQVYRNIIAHDYSIFNHVVFGEGSAAVIDENKIKMMHGSSAVVNGVVNSKGNNFHTVMHVEPESPEYHISVVYKDLLQDDANVSYFPIISPKFPVGDLATIDVSNINLDELSSDTMMHNIHLFISDTVDHMILERIDGSARFYKDKMQFLKFQ
jgi:hypothetical protein